MASRTFAGPIHLGRSCLLGPLPQGLWPWNVAGIARSEPRAPCFGKESASQPLPSWLHRSAQGLGPRAFECSGPFGGGAKSSLSTLVGFRKIITKRGM